MVPSRISSRLFGHGDGKQRDASQKKRSKFGSYVALTKPRIIELLLVTTIPTMVLAAGKWPSVSLMVITLLGGSLAAGGANAINMYIDRDIDALMVRTQGRPLVTGDIRPQNALMFAVLLEIAAFAVLWSGANLLSALLALSATMFYVCIYSLWLKRTSKQNIVIGGAAGAVPVLVGWAAVQNSLGWAPVILFLVIFFWTPPHFWALAIRHSDDYRAAGVPMLPVVATMQETVRSMVIYSVILTATSLALIPVADLGYIYGITALLFGTLFILGSIRLGRDPSESRSMRLFSFSITYVSVLFMALTVDVLVN
ncbi:MAG TPA: protoheme IX farnesyltransferase [Acidimicrobium sp.]|jgi:heme o synthase|nr:protoheme IX farnesyltransferase [Acidimicrobium sp.]